MGMKQKMLEINPDTLLAQGATRKVYPHPLDDNLLLKVLKPMMHSNKLLSRFNPRRAQYGFMTTAYREYEEYIRAIARLNRMPTPLPRFHGFVNTNLGVAMVVEKIKDTEGNLAPNITAYVVENGFTDHLNNMIDDLEYTIKLERIVCSDLTCENVVVSANGLIVVDGSSDKLIFSFNRYSKKLFLKWCGRKFSKLRISALSRLKE